MTTDPKSRHRPDAFTLVELLLVIGIIALLIAILLPTLNKARAAANRATCLSNIRQLGIGVIMYCDGNKGWFPTCAYWANGSSYVQNPDDWIYWQANRTLDDSPIAKYLNARGDKLKNLLRCPADSFDGRKAALSIIPGQGPYLYSYGLNEAVGTNLKSFDARTRITWWRSPSRKIMISEAIEKYDTAPVWTYGGPLTKRHGTTRFNINVPGNPEMSLGTRAGANVSAFFFDGHAGGVDQNYTFDFSQMQPLAR